MDAASAAILKRETFYDRPWMERLTSYGISVHEGHLFGWVNQAISLFTATGLFLLAISFVVLWSPASGCVRSARATRQNLGIRARW